jgi:diguanylate cyclase (GGDEF)-like protein
VSLKIPAFQDAGRGMFRNLLSPVAFTVLVTGAAELSAIVAATIAMLFAGYSNFLFAFGLAAGVPAIVAPITIYPLVRSNRELRIAQVSLKEAALTDDLTRLPNRRCFFERAEEMLSLATEQGQSVAVMMVDLDRFKEVNDTHGHIVGDAVLAAIGTRIRDAVADFGGPDWIVARLGGEEFAVLATGMTSSSVARLAERIRRHVRDTDFELEGRRIETTVSVGVSIGSANVGIDAVLKAADDAAYIAKRAGRDRWSFAIPAAAAPGSEAAVG